MAPITNAVLAVSIDGLRSDVNKLTDAVIKQNGRIGTIEIARAREAGAQEATAQITASSIALKDKSRTWWVGAGALAFTAIGTTVTVGTLIAHALIYHTL